MPESDHPRWPEEATVASQTRDRVPTPADRQCPAGALHDLEHDREVLSWLQCSPQLSPDVRGYLVDALLDWALGGRGYPQMALPDGGTDCDHLQALQQIIARLPQRIAQAQTVADKLELGRAGRMLSRALRAARDPQGVEDALNREVVMAMPWLADQHATFEPPEGWSR